MAEKDELLEAAAVKQQDPGAPDKDENGEPGGDIGGQGVAGGEVRAVEPPTKGGIGPLLLGLLLLVGLIAGGLYLVKGTVISRTPQLGAEAHKRYSIDQVKEEQISEPAVAAVAPSAEESLVAVKTASKAPAVVPAEEKEPAKKIAKTVAEPKQAAPVRHKVAAGGTPLYQVLVGPYLYVSDTNDAAATLAKLGYQGRKIEGSGPVAMVRLLVGSYPPDDARAQLASLKPQLDDAFLLPDGNQLAVYAGSFSDRKRAERYVKVLAEQGLTVTPIVNELEMSGKMFIVGEAGQEQARKIIEKLTAAGLNARMKPVNN